MALVRMPVRAQSPKRKSERESRTFSRNSLSAGHTFEEVPIVARQIAVNGSLLVSHMCCLADVSFSNLQLAARRLRRIVAGGFPWYGLHAARHGSPQHVTHE